MFLTASNITCFMSIYLRSIYLLSLVCGFVCICICIYTHTYIERDFCVNYALKLFFFCAICETLQIFICHYCRSVNTSLRPNSIIFELNGQELFSCHCRYHLLCIMVYSKDISSVWGQQQIQMLNWQKEVSMCGPCPLTVIIMNMVAISFPGDDSIFHTCRNSI